MASGGGAHFRAAAHTMDARLASIEYALGLPSGSEGDGPAAAPAEVREVSQRRRPQPLRGARRRPRRPQLKAKIAELEKALAKRDFRIQHLLSALDAKDTKLKEAGAKPFP